MKQESRLAVAEYMLEVAAALNSDDTLLDSVTTMKPIDIDTEVGHYRSDLIMHKRLIAKQHAGQQMEAALPQEMSDDELHAELDRQLVEEKQRVDRPSVSEHGNSEEALG